MTNMSSEPSIRGPIDKYLAWMHKYNRTPDNQRQDVFWGIYTSILGILLLPVVVLWALAKTVVSIFDI